MLHLVLLCGGPAPDGDRVASVALGVLRLRVTGGGEDTVEVYRLEAGRRARVGTRDLAVYAFEHARRL